MTLLPFSIASEWMRKWAHKSLQIPFSVNKRPLLLEYHLQVYLVNTPERERLDAELIQNNCKLTRKFLFEVTRAP
jgi:hypothetical protein